MNSYLAVTYCGLILYIFPGLILNGLVAVALAGEIAKKQGRVQWVILLNISLAGILATLSLAVCSVSSLFLVNNVQEDAKWVCRVEFSAIHISIAIRTASLALLSVVVFIIIKHGLSKVKLPPLIACLCHYIQQCCLCTFRSNLSLIDILGRSISVCTIIAATVHVKWNTVTDFNRVKTPCCNSLWYSFASKL